MNHDFYGPAWADNHDKLSGDIEQLARSLWRGLQRLQARRFAAPWRHAGRMSIAK